MKKRFLAIILVLVMAVTPISALAEGEASYNLANALKNYVDANYKYEMDDDAVIDFLMKELLTRNPELFAEVASVIMESLDEHSKYYTKEEFDEFFAYVESEYSGIGAYLTSDGEYCKVTGFLDGSPAEKAGMLADDIIYKVNGEVVTGLDSNAVATKARGETGTSVEITVLRDGKEITFKIIREKLNENTVEHTLLDENVAYIQILSFSSATGQEFTDALTQYKRQGIKKYIVDLRNNSGGVTNEALTAVSNFIEKDKPLLKVSNKRTGEYTYYNPRYGEKQELVVLINENTASAAEIFAAAIKDNKAGIIMGTKSYGKGTMQNTLSLGDFGGIKLTVSEFFTPNGEEINKVGIAPDEYVANVERLATAEDFEPLTYEKKFYLGDSDPQILALKDRLRVLRYFGGDMDEYFDATLDAAVKRFQTDTGLYPCGDLDFTTQTFIQNLVLEATVLEDTQLDKAYEYLTK